jgi:acetylornithine deacetylase
MDAALVSAAGIEPVVFRPGGHGAHAVNEFGDVASVVQTADVLMRTAVTFCR